MVDHFLFTSYLLPIEPVSTMYVSSIKLTIITMSVIIILLKMVIDNNNDNTNNNNNNLGIYYHFKIYYGIINDIKYFRFIFCKMESDITSLTTIYTVAYSYIISFIMYVYHMCMFISVL